MEISDILSTLGLDLSNPETKRGALEAIEAILNSRSSGTSGTMDGNTETEVELDPDLIQPSIKQAPSGVDQDDIEIEDEENILDQIKHKESEDPIENTNSAGSDSASSDRSDSNQDSENNDDFTDTSNENDWQSEADESDDDSNDASKDDSFKNSTEDEESTPTSQTADDAEEDGTEDETEFDSEADFEDGDTTEEETEYSETDSGKTDSTEDTNDAEESDTGESDEDGEELENSDAADLKDEGSTEDDEELDFDEDDLIDDDLKNSTEDEEIKTKHEARKIKRERTLTAAKKALADAQAKKVAPALIRELEKSIEALEALTEAAKSIKDVSDEEFNRLVNRVFDAIQACGDSGLTFSSEEERASRVKEIKNDMASATTQAELSAEDTAKIRAETQAIKAREKEVDKYKPKSASSFRGFQDFLNSLYRAIALQVHTEETQDDSWSALNRRYSGSGVLQPGKKIQELPNKKIPIIDFYFDCSGSWGADDIRVGKKAVAALAEMEEQGQIKINLYYFSDKVSNVYEDVAGGGTGAWNYIIKNIISTQATNVVIMTDDDMESMGRNRAGANNFLSYTVPGYVWYLWKNGYNAPRLPRDLKGRGGVQQFAFNTSDA